MVLCKFVFPSCKRIPHTLDYLFSIEFYCRIKIIDKLIRSLAFDYGILFIQSDFDIQFMRNSWDFMRFENLGLKFWKWNPKYFKCTSNYRFFSFCIFNNRKWNWYPFPLSLNIYFLFSVLRSTKYIIKKIEFISCHFSLFFFQVVTLFFGLWPMNHF